VRTLSVARDLLREARARRWVLALAAGVTLLLLVAASALELEVVDGALAASRFFGERVNDEIRPADVALRPLFEGVSYVVFYAGTLLGILACADFAPALLAPGRIEHLLALPVRRWEVVLGTFLGVLALVLLGALYGGGGLALVVWAKTGVFGAGPVASAGLAAVAFAPIYAVMVLAAVAARSAALSAMAGGATWVLGIVAGSRETLAPLFREGFGRDLFLAATAPLPRISELARAGARVARGLPPEGALLAAQVGAAALFALALLSLAVGLFERKDF
jgi:Cu-processing system permease protein